MTERNGKRRQKKNEFFSPGSPPTPLPSGAGNLVVATPDGAPGISSLRALVAADVPTLNQNTSGTAANLSGTPALPNGTTATTQAALSADTKLATDAYVDSAVSAATPAWSSLTGTITNGKVIPYGDSGISRLGARSLAVGNGTNGDSSGSLKLSGITLTGSASGVGNLQMTSGASSQYETNLTYLGSNTNTGGFLFGSVLANDANNGPGFIGRGNAFAAITHQRGLLYLTAGNITSPVAPLEGALVLATGNNVTSLVVRPDSTVTFGGVDAGISRVGAASLAIGNGTAGNKSGILSLAVKINAGGFTVATLPSTAATGMVEGATSYATNGRKIGELAGSGTGVPVYFSNGSWRVFSTDAAVAS